MFQHHLWYESNALFIFLLWQLAIWHKIGIHSCRSDLQRKSSNVSGGIGLKAGHLLLTCGSQHLPAETPALMQATLWSITVLDNCICGFHHWHCQTPLGDPTYNHRCPLYTKWHTKRKIGQKNGNEDRLNACLYSFNSKQLQTRQKEYKYKSKMDRKYK